MKQLLQDHDLPAFIGRHSWMARILWSFSVLGYAVVFGMLAQILVNEARIDQNQSVIIHNQGVNTCLIRNGASCGSPEGYKK